MADVIALSGANRINRGGQIAVTRPASGYLPFTTDPSDLATYREVWRPGGWTYRDPEREIRHAVLEQAIHDLHHDSKSEHGAVLREEARVWFQGGWPDGPYSFAAVCEALSLDPDTLRAGILAGGGRGYRQHSQVVPVSRLAGRRERKR